MHPRDAVRLERVHRRRGRGERAVAGLVDAPRPRPAGPRGQAESVALGEAGHVGLIDGHGGDLQPPGRGDPARTEGERRRQMDDVGSEGAQGGEQRRSRHAHGQRADLGDHDRRHAHHGHAVVLGGRGGDSGGGVRSDDERVVAAGVGVLEDAQDRVGDTVDVGQERFGDHGNAHDSDGPALGRRVGRAAVTYRRTEGESCPELGGLLSPAARAAGEPGSAVPRSPR